ncbi:MAG: single-stranded DNA-binding protein [Elusimicrobia bacterium]|nr:single-stranded DNA-binding protein [Elusimicrobiota bacterium]
MATGVKVPEVNLVVLAGRLTRDPDVRYLPSGKPVARVPLASNSRFFNKTTNEWQEEATFVDVSVWGDAAERVKDRLKKGSPVLVEGRLKFRQWEAKDGTKRSALEVSARRLQFLEAFHGSQGSPSSAASEEAAAAAGSDAPPTFGAAESEEATSDLEGVAL